MKDIPSRIEILNGEQQLLNKSLLDLKTRDGHLPDLSTAISALTMQVLYVICHSLCLICPIVLWYLQCFDTVGWASGRASCV